MLARSLLLNLLGADLTASSALRGVANEADRTGDALDRLNNSPAGNALAALGRAAGGAAGSIGMASAQIGAAVPVAAALAATLANLAPAAGLAATGLIAAGLAGTALKVGMTGVGDAVKAALDPANPEALAEALKKLSPNAREFVGAIQEMQPALAGIKTAVQDALFEGMDKSLTKAARSTLPLFKTGLTEAASALNGMGREVLATATQLADNGTLGKALGSATKGLGNLRALPATIVQGLVQVGAAAGPAFERLTMAAGRGLEGVSRAMTKSFESGGMERAIDQAVDLFGQLWDVAKNVGQVIGNVFKAAQSGGGGLIGVLKTVTGEIAKITAGPEVQAGLKALFTTMGQLATTAAPLLGMALKAIGGVLTALGPPAQTLIKALGDGLRPIIQALGPVLAAAATAVGQLVVAFAPLLPVIGQLIAGLLPALTPFITKLGEIFTQLAPVVQQVADILSASLAPILAELPGLAQPLADLMGEMSLTLLPLLADLLVQLAPSFVQLGAAFGQVLAAVAPLIAVLAQLAAEGLARLVPILTPVITKVAELTALLVGQFARFLTGVVVPAIQSVSRLLQGDFSGAWQAAERSVRTAAIMIMQGVTALASNIVAAIRPLGGRLKAAASAAFDAFRAAVVERSNAAVAFVRSIPGRMLSALGNLGGLLRGAGISVMQGFIAGVQSMIGPLTNLLGSISSLIPKVKGPPAADAVMLEPAGRLIMGGLIRGIEWGTPKLVDTLKGVGRRISGEMDGIGRRLGSDGETVGSYISAGISKALTGSSSEIDGAIKKLRDMITKAYAGIAGSTNADDVLIDRLMASNVRLKRYAEGLRSITELIKKAREFAERVTQDALNFAAMTSLKPAEGNDTLSGGEIVAGLQAKLATLRAFASNISKLAKAGLSRSLLAQLINAGPDAGAAMAAELASGPNSVITSLNSTQNEINKVAKKLGLDTSDALFDAGANSGKGFLAGLKGQQGAIQQAMEDFAEKLIETINKALGKINKSTSEIGNKLQYAPVPTVPTGPKVALPTPVKPQSTVKPMGAQGPSGGGKTVNLNMGGVTVKETADADQIINRMSFASRSAGF